MVQARTSVSKDENDVMASDLSKKLSVKFSGVATNQGIFGESSFCLELPLSPVTSMNLHRKRYTSDLTDAQWQIIESLIPPQRPGGDKRTTDMRQ